MDEIKVADLKFYSRGVVRCPFCFLEFSNPAHVLEVSPCPRCGTRIFFPARIKDYVLYKPIGGGGVGHVFKARNIDSRQEKFAVKLVQKAKKKDSVYAESLLREGRVGTVVGDHPNLLSIIEYGCEGNEYYIVTPFIDGERLDDYIGRKGHISEKRAISIIMQIVEAEMHICSKGYLYRDLKPENIMLEKKGMVKMFDYGLCIPKEEALSRTVVPDEFEGSPFYVPPERIVGASEGEYSEIYSLGMILFHMLKGRPYYTESEINDLITKHVSSFRILSVKSLIKGCHHRIVSLIDKMIARKPDNRYRDFASLKTDLKLLEAEIEKKPSILLKGAKKSTAPAPDKSV